MPINPCECSRSRETAMTCPREPRGTLIWKADDKGFGPLEVVTPDGQRAVLTFNGEEWSHFSEGLARDHAAIRHLDFVVG